MDMTTRAVTLKTTDIGDNDKLLTIYSLEHGKLTVTARGIRKSTAKLKFAREPFCFGNFELAERSGRYTLKTCIQQESFASIASDISSYYSGCAMVDMISTIEQEGQSNSKLFVVLLQALSSLDSGMDSGVVLVKYMLDYLSCSGYNLTIGKCHMCGGEGEYLDVALGGVVCSNCRSNSSLSVAKGATTLLRLIDSIEYSKLGNIRADIVSLEQCLQLLHTYIIHILGKVKCLTSYINLPK